LLGVAEAHLGMRAELMLSRQLGHLAKAISE
jgi:hypothetical protein